MGHSLSPPSHFMLATGLCKHHVKGVEKLCFVVSLYNFVESNTMATEFAWFRLSDK